MKLPQKIRNFIGNNRLIVNKVGQSPSDVYCFERNRETFFLKVSSVQYATTTYSVAREAQMMLWLADKINVPELVFSEIDQNFEYMLSKSIDAQPISDLSLAQSELIMLYQDVLSQLRSVPVQNCPFNSDINSRLQESQYFMEIGLLNQVDDEDVDIEVWGEHQSYLELWTELNNHRVKENLVFTHGDITDSNIFVDQSNKIYFLALGRAGLADEFVDIAFVERCLREDGSEESAQKFLKQLSFDDPSKRQYFLKLDELN